MPKWETKVPYSSIPSLHFRLCCIHYNPIPDKLQIKLQLKVFQLLSLWAVLFVHFNYIYNIIVIIHNNKCLRIDKNNFITKI